METKQLVPFVLMIVLVGMIIGVGVLTLDKFSVASFYTRTGYNDTITAPANNTRIALDYGNITAVSKLSNGTFQDTLSSTCYEVFTANGSFVYYNQSVACNTYGANLNLIYDYREYATASRNAVNSATTEVSNISSNWLGLIVTIMVLSIIIVLVVRSFGFGGTR